MSSESKYISVGEEQLHYLEWGSGKHLLLAFPGYGDDATIFEPIRPYLSDCTILSIDMPFHGQSKWNGGKVLAKKDLFAAIKGLMLMYHTDKVSLLGYSMGGRICLSIVEHMAADIDRVVLLATDGLAGNPYYYFFTKTVAGKRLFKKMLEKPDAYLRMIEWLRKRKLVDLAKYKFVMHFLGSADRRAFLQKVWPNTSELVSSPSRVKAAIRKYRIPVSIFMGAYDRIIPVRQAEQFIAGLDTAELFVLDKGHRLFDHETVREIAARLH